MKVLMIVLFFLLTSNQSTIDTDPSGHIDKDRKVARVPIGEDLKITTSQIPQHCGEWQIVEIDEDFSVKFVEVGEDFTVRFVDIIE